MGSVARADTSVASARHDDPAESRTERTILDRSSWAYQTPRLQALGFAFAIRASDAAIGRFLHGLFRNFETPGEPMHVYSFIDHGPASEERYEVFRDNEQVSVTPSAGTALRHLVWDVNREAVASAQGLLLLHASAVEHDGRAVLFPAPMGSGKTTLVAGLVHRGLRYITDEAVAIDPATFLIRPYPKPLSIESGSWHVLEDLRPDVDPALETFFEHAWYLSADEIRTGALAPACTPGTVIVPRYERGARTELVETRRSDALIALAENSFNITSFATQSAMELLADVVRGCRGYRLSVGDLSDACDLILEMLRAPSAGSGQ